MSYDYTIVETDILNDPIKIKESSFIWTEHKYDNLITNSKFKNMESWFVEGDIESSENNQLVLNLDEDKSLYSSFYNLNKNSYIISASLKSTDGRSVIQIGLEDTDGNIVSSMIIKLHTYYKNYYFLYENEGINNNLRFFYKNLIGYNKLYIKSPEIKNMDLELSPQRLADNLTINEEHLSKTSYSTFMIEYETTNVGIIFEMRDVRQRFNIKSDMTWEHKLNSGTLISSGNLLIPPLIERKLVIKTYPNLIKVIHSEGFIDLPIHLSILKGIKIGSSFDNNNYINGFIKQWLYWPQEV